MLKKLLDTTALFLIASTTIIDIQMNQNPCFAYTSRDAITNQCN